jgi:hypothetical protein
MARYVILLLPNAPERNIKTNIFQFSPASDEGTFQLKSPTTREIVALGSHPRPATIQFLDPTTVAFKSLFRDLILKA